ncbi:unnamed protein product [Brassica rapa]|uniref:Uncharacterized protein n=1 Tax=Brassica campestris TaxID=3711 RepID=A0A3P5ZF22_BRACM|nr:unnamed protein product [Brassica rapa]VDC78612.1 unnamed protein product [Brassica rapa]
MSRLKAFSLKGCRKLVSVPPILEYIDFIDASDCESLEMIECSFRNQFVWLKFANCFKLNQEARDLIIQNSCRYAVLPGGQVPPHFTHRATGAGPLTIKLNEKPLPISMKFKVSDC